MIQFNQTTEKLSEILMTCQSCGWEGTFLDCTPYITDEGFSCPCCKTAHLERTVAPFCLSFHRMSDHRVQVKLNGQFLMQFTGDEKLPEYYLAQDLRVVADTLEQLSIMGKNAATAAEIFREKIRKEYAVYE